MSVLQTTLRPLALPPAAASAMRALGGAPVWKTLSFAMQPQQQTEWCWAAVTASVSLFYSAASSWAQCSLANNQLGQTTCCADGSSAGCNQPWYLDQSLTTTANLATFLTGTISFADVGAQIDADRPVGVRIGWKNGGGHFVVIDGYSDSNLLDIQDPWYGPSTVDYNTFSTSYQGSGTWTHTYLTQP